MIDQIIGVTRDKMKKSVEVTENDLRTIRSGKATPSLVENIIVSAYDGTQKLKVMEMATITTSDSKTIVISPYDPSQKNEICKGIMENHAGLNPHVDGDIIRLVLPPLSQERRQEYIKLAKTKIEAGKIMIRQLRQDSMKQVKNYLERKTISEDEEKIGEKKIQEITDEYVLVLEDIFKKKEQELSQI